MNDQTIYVTNRSTLVTDTDARTMTVAVDRQMRLDVEPAWHLRRTPVRYSATPPAGARTIVLVDVADDPQALGYHTDDLAPAGIVGCKPELDQGAHPLTGPYSVASILSHEVLELAVDPSCNLWADTGRGHLVAVEVGDPVQSDHYDVAGVTVSNFVLPAWFDATPDTAGARVDHLGTLSAPFTLSRGGYWIQMAAGAVTQKFGADMPDWLVATKQAPLARTNRRGT